MTRSIKKGPFVDPKLQKKVDRARAQGSRAPIKTYSRASMIMPDMVGLSFSVHRGNEFVTVLVSENMVGHRLGEFAQTRIFRNHSGNR